MIVTTGARRTRSLLSSASSTSWMLFFLVADLVSRGAKLTGEFFGQFDIECLVDSGEDLLFDQFF